MLKMDLLKMLNGKAKSAKMCVVEECQINVSRDETYIARIEWSVLFVCLFFLLVCHRFFSLDSFLSLACVSERWVTAFICGLFLVKKKKTGFFNVHTSTEHVDSNAHRHLINTTTVFHSLGAREHTHQHTYRRQMWSGLEIEKETNTFVHIRNSNKNLSK